MADMARPKKTPPGDEQKPVIKTRARDRGEVVLLTAEVDPTIHAAFVAFVRSHRPKTTRRAILEWALEEFLGKRNALPYDRQP